MDTLRPPNVVNAKDIPWQTYGKGRYVRHRKDLGRAIGTRGLGIRIERVEPGKSDVPLHWHLAEEEGFMGLEGEGVLLQTDDQGAPIDRSPFRAGDAVVFPPDRRVGHRLDVPEEAEAAFTFLVFGERAAVDVAAYPGRDAWLVRKGTQGPVAARGDGLGMFRPRPIDYHDGLDDAEGPEAPGGSAMEHALPDRFGTRDNPTPPAPSPIIAIDDVPPRIFGKEGYARACARLAPRLGCERFDLNLDTIDPGHCDSPMHHHLGDEECFHILEGEGILHMGGPGWPDPPVAARIRAGDTLAFPPATGIAHQIRVPKTATRPLRMITLATRAPVDVVHMTHSNKWILKRADLPKEALRTWGSAIVHDHRADWLDDEPPIDG